MSNEEEQLERQIVDAAESMFDYLKHGDEKHREWLKAALYAFFRSQPCPEMQ